MINEIINKKSKSTNTDCIKNCGQEVSNSREIANVMNHCICTVGTSLAKNIEETENSFLLGRHKIKSSAPSFRPCSDGNGTERNAIVPKSGTLRGCVQTGPLQIEPFRSKSWTYSISDTKSGIGPFRFVPFPSEQTNGRMSKVRV